MPGIIFFYLRLIFSAQRTASKPNALAGWCLLHKRSYRTSGKVFGPADVTRRLLSVLSWKSNSPSFVRLDNANSTVGVWDNRDVLETRLGQITFNGGVSPSVFIRRDAMGARGAAAFIAACFYILLWPWMCIWSLFAEHPRNVALLYTQWNEAMGLIKVVRELKLKYLYFYTPYETDGNALYLLLKKEGVTVNKIPSPNLLSIANQEMLSDVLTLTSPSQLDDLKRYENTISVSKTERWLPEFFPTYDAVYRDGRQTPPRNSIGFYSHGSWMRRATGVLGTDLGDIEAEEQLVVAFGSFLKAHPEFTCTVFLHPKEKKTERQEEARKYYDTHFGAGRYDFADLKVPGAKLFDTVDIGVGAFSTILFERLFLGCKTIFYPPGIRIFPASGAEIAALCCTSESELEALILQAAKQSTSEFLSALNLKKYTICDWKPELKYAEHN